MESWKWIGEQQGLKVLLTAASDGGRGAIDLEYRVKFQEVRRSVHRDKGESVIALVREAEAVAERIDFRIVYSITKELACGRKSLDGGCEGR